MSKWSETKDPRTNDVLIHITLSQSDFIKARFDKWDHLLLNDCAKSNKLSDKALALETILLRMEQSYE